MVIFQGRENWNAGGGEGEEFNSPSVDLSP